MRVIEAGDTLRDWPTFDLEGDSEAVTSALRKEPPTREQVCASKQVRKVDHDSAKRHKASHKQQRGTTERAGQRTSQVGPPSMPSFHRRLEEMMRLLEAGIHLTEDLGFGLDVHVEELFMLQMCLATLVGRDQRACMQQPASRGSSSAHRTHGTSMHRSKQHMTCTCSMMLINVGPTSPTRCASACGGADPCSGATM